MPRIRALIFLSALVVGVFGGFVFGAGSAGAAPHGFMTCHVNVLDEDWTPTERAIECYY